MAGKPRTKGSCVFCGKEMTRAGMQKHLASCKMRSEKRAEAEASSKTVANLCQILVYSPYDSDFWLYLEVNGAATLEKLDFYLRRIWLECCGHMSQFCFDRFYGEEISMKTRIHKIFVPELELFYAYDFGSTTELKVKLMGMQVGKPLTKNPVYLLARNNMPDVPCDKCGKPGAWIDLEAMYEYGEFSALCDKHNKGKNESNYGEMRLVNSPRAGVCSYEGPADPPY